MHNCNPEGKKHILKSWAMRADAWTVWELVIAGNWLGYRYLGASWFMNIFEVMQFCVQSRNTSSQKEFSMHQVNKCSIVVNKCSIVVSFEGVCSALSTCILSFLASNSWNANWGYNQKKILQQQNSVPNIREEKFIPIKLMLFLLDQLHIYILRNKSKIM